ncbi:hypothetical protein [Mycolicibacterium frederiksbergense]|uniref:Uncharacterized protein n=1 Tax=Mycolicibacterium frederiksbergense TaxID=117567 RepID=A0A6H0RYP8_9MYCO|nr:hypothetical protein [Mycolicibacterium frederiksbergense]QIV79611.1 hypothetical protein EXE63_00770 [Mycolicibacterium frederiksbergense]
MLNVLQRNVIQGYLDGGMSPEDIADFLGRVNDLGPLDIVTIKSAAYDLLNEPAAPATAAGGKPVLTVIAGGAA